LNRNIKTGLITGIIAFILLTAEAAIYADTLTLRMVLKGISSGVISGVIVYFITKWQDEK
jgi:hypothetical protein